MLLVLKVIQTWKSKNLPCQGWVHGYLSMSGIFNINFKISTFLGGMLTQGNFFLQNQMDWTRKTSNEARLIKAKPQIDAYSFMLIND